MQFKYMHNSIDFLKSSLKVLLSVPKRESINYILYILTFTSAIVK